MAFTAYKTQAVGDPVIAADWNTHIRDNGNEGAVAKVTTAGDIVYATGATALARLGIGAAGGVLAVNAGATAPEWKVPVSASASSTATWNGTNSSAWVGDVLTVSITPGGAYGKILIIAGAEKVTDDTMSLRCGIGADDGAVTQVGASGAGTTSSVCVHIVNNASAAAQTVGLDIWTNEINGNGVAGYRWIYALWLP